MFHNQSLNYFPDIGTRRIYLMKKALKDNVAPVLVHPSLFLAIELFVILGLE
jgi:hypothetical protein